jgi:hypothetical protein
MASLRLRKKPFADSCGPNRIQGRDARLLGQSTSFLRISFAY